VLLTGCAGTLAREDRGQFARCIDKGMPIQFLLDTIGELFDSGRLPECDATPGQSGYLVRPSHPDVDNDDTAVRPTAQDF
jgi:hypothetical protein